MEFCGNSCFAVGYHDLCYLSGSLRHLKTKSGGNRLMQSQYARARARVCDKYRSVYFVFSRFVR